MSNEKENVEKINTKNPLESIAKQVNEQEAKQLNEQLKKEFAEVIAARKVLANATEKALDTNSKIKALQTSKPIDLAALANSLGV
jgi:hypothetical protein